MTMSFGIGKPMSRAIAAQITHYNSFSGNKSRPSTLPSKCLQERLLLTCYSYVNGLLCNLRRASETLQWTHCNKNAARGVLQRSVATTQWACCIADLDFSEVWGGLLLEGGHMVPEGGMCLRGATRQTRSRKDLVTDPLQPQPQLIKLPLHR